MVDSPGLRALIPRLFGLLVFAVAGLLAVGLVVYGVTGSQAWLVNAMQSLSSWVSAPLSSGAAVLLGMGLLALAALLAFMMAPGRPRTVRMMRRGKSGTTLMDTVSVAVAIESKLRREVDSTIKVECKGGRLRVVTPFVPRQPFELVDQAGISVRQQLETLGLADMIEYEITTGREAQRRRVQ